MIDAFTIDTPTGPLSVLTEAEVIVAAGFTDPETMWARLAPERQLPMTVRPEVGGVTRAVAAYFDGQLDAFDELKIDQPGTVLQQQLWDGLRAIPAGQTRTYTQLAADTDNPAAVRAAGTACGRNLVAPMVPCHRALRRDGSLGGYYYGLEVKRWLLAHEAQAT